MLNQEQIRIILNRVEDEVEEYFDYKNVRHRSFEINYDSEKGIYPHIEYLFIEVGK
ncbi:hypothetical protein [Gemella cuniculi]|uniref:hypothetical protein n=1 Tax=Gemella cuniculi TaxID=150240 RepID=UPI0004211B62|nr:hypothetical protein [Gemella cuniculi]